MSEKKVKIDLKARLGRASKGGAPPTATPGAVPPPAAGIAPPPGIVSGGIPAPPFAAQQKKTGPKIKADEPFQAVAAEEGAKPQDIKVEIGHDVVQAQKKGFVKVILAAVLAALVGAGLGWALGSMRTRNVADQLAVADAKSLIEPVAKTKTSVEELQTKIAAATKTLYKEKKYPEDFSKELARTEIPFSAADLGGKALHRLKPSLMRMLFDFARDAQELSARKDALRRLFDARKSAIIELIEQGKNPRISYSVFVQKDRKGNAIATFVELNKPFKFDEKEWPKELKLDTGSEVVDANRYSSGEPFMKHPRREGDKPTIYAIPIEPDGLSKAFPPRLSQRIESELKAIAGLISGTQPGQVRPEDEKPGLLKLADDIIRELNAVGAKR
ncbi:MAG: hypothetical protein ACOC1F_04560 [Myxococcota bacterium]